MRAFLVLQRPACHACGVWRVQVTRHHSSNAAASVIGKRDPFKRSSRSSRTSLPDHPARTRFAPSPTGYLHLGSLRTALFNYLLARATGGQFILRLEDTDQSRIVRDAEQRLFGDLHWAGLAWDEGPDVGGPYGPYKQSERLSLYRGYAEQLIESDRAFRCFCSKEDLDRHQRQALENGEDPGLYSGACMAISAEESAERAARGDSHTVRFKSSRTPTGVSDLVYGFYTKKDPETQFIIMKSDGFPTYHFANVVDDHLMEITHVVRGSEWLISTPKHAEIYQAFGWAPPKFCHVGLLVDGQRQKLSKRNHDIGIDSYRDTGILPSALLNFAVLLGWRPGAGRETGLFYRLEELAENFSLAFTKGDTMVDPSKLESLQRRHFNRLLTLPGNETEDLDHSLRSLYRAVQREIETVGTDATGHPYDDIRQSTDGRLLLSTGESAGERPSTEYIHEVFKIQKGASRNAKEFVEKNRHIFWGMPESFLRQTSDVILTARVRVGGEEASPASAMAKVEEAFRDIPEWTVENIKTVADGLVNDMVLDFEDGTQAAVGGGWRFLRWALLGSSAGPQLIRLMALLGREETMQRLTMASRVASEGKTSES